MIKVFIIALIFQTQPTLDSIELIDSNEILKQVVDLNKDKKYLKSIALLEQVNEVDSNYFLVQISMIDTYTSNSQLNKAEDLGESLMKEHKYLPSNFYITLGNALLNNGFTDKAIDVYKEGLNHFPYYHILIYNLGYSKYAKKEYTEALKYFQQVLLLSPYYSSAHQMIGNIMAKTNQRTKAILSYMAYLAINPDKNWALIRINNLVNDAYREEGTIDLPIDNQYFDFYDNLLRSKAALDDRYSTQIGLEAPVSQQCELLLNKLKYVEGTNDFWMNFYVPFFSRISENNFVKPFMYFILTSAKNEDVKKWLDKNKKEKDGFIALASDYLNTQKNVNVRTVQDVEASYSHWYYDNGKLQIIGKESGGHDVGPYEYYFSNGRLQAKGVYSNEGKKQGNWSYYHDNGQLKSVESYNSERKLDGKISSYLADGKLNSIGNYKDGKLDGHWEWYFPCGSIKEIYPYDNGIGNGQGKEYYSTGELKTNYNIKDGLNTGTYISYYKPGNISSSYNYEKGVVSGKYTSFHANGKKNGEGMYEDGKLSGIWSVHYSNGKLKRKGDTKRGNKVGEWNYYYTNGNPRLTEQYNQDSLLNGETKFYDDDGILHLKQGYDNGLLISYSYYSKQGEMLINGENPEGDMTYNQYYTTGQEYTKGTLVGGKINGKYVSYHQNGIVYQEGNKKDNNWDGVYKEYDESGIITVHCKYKEGTLNGFYRTFFLNGKVKEEGWILDGNVQQKWKEYYVSGGLKKELYYTDGTLNGSSKTYGPEGRLFIEDVYEDGKVIGFKQFDTLGVMYNDISTPLYTGKISRKSPSGVTQSTKSISCGENSSDVIYYYPSGKLLTKYEMKNSEFESYSHYSPDGKIKSEGKYINGEKSGDWSYYYDNGELESKYPYHEGEIEGVSKDYYETGTLEYESNYYQGERNGSTTYYDSNGQLQVIKYYRKNFGAYAYQYLLPSGEMSDTVLLKITGDEVLNAYFQNGKMSVSQQYKNGYFHGDVVYYASNGVAISKSTFVNGESHGKKLTYYPNGNLKSEVKYFFDEIDGEEKEYYSNGNLKKVVSWRNGVENGWTKSFNENGKLLTQTYYWNGYQY